MSRRLSPLESAIRFAVSCMDDFPLSPDMTATRQAAGTWKVPRNGVSDPRLIAISITNPVFRHFAGPPMTPACPLTSIPSINHSCLQSKSANFSEWINPNRFSVSVGRWAPAERALWREFVLDIFIVHIL